MAVTVAVVGANGRMGTLVSRIVEEDPELELVASLGSSSPWEEMLAADLVVDVTQPGVTGDVVRFAVEHGRKVLVGTSGWSAERIDELRGSLAASPEAGVIIIPNFSLGSVLATRLSSVAARFYDSIEIIEAHHAGKVDSPSGTAVRTAELMAEARGALGPVAAPHVDQLARGQQVAGIPVHSLRLQGVVARQEVVFGGTGELLSVVHDTISPAAYEKGIRLALAALPAAHGVTVGLESLLDLGSLTS
ncbi:4-hydroxy-tetrahydrodipicolinate reductase [Homoserinimonas sedimenticola]|uniref:4-hydroxy-tetrahydrodipicolinate reductase n=1 Tax=Homoserinimonas sedimenticola TaxID=2986805 RepID=UPI0027E23BE4|nr:4-hydroxy-tetrahydrodipicolinate reductase [Salinibacterium sedimenticola]